MKALLDANRLLLQDAAALVLALDDITYVRLYPAFASGSVAQHLRHVLDHYDAILQRRDGVIDYDIRRRESPLETSRHAGLVEIRRVLAALVDLDDGKVRVCSEVSPADVVVVEAESTLRRELMFATSHAVHHFALIAMLLRAQGVPVPAEFGVAPATLTHQRSAAGAETRAS